MSHDGSVSEWIVNLKQGDSAAAQKIWQRYYARLMHLAHRKLANSPRRMSDEDDVALDAFTRLCAGVAENRFPQLNDRDDLWQILLMLTTRVAASQRRRELADKRGGGDLLGESAIGGPGLDQSGPFGVGQVAGDEPTPELAALLAEQFRRRLDLLGSDAELRQIALDKLAGYSNVEIAGRLGVSLRSVERQLNLIRRIWSWDGRS